MTEDISQKLTDTEKSCIIEYVPPHIRALRAVERLEAATWPPMKRLPFDYEATKQIREENICKSQEIKD